MVIEFSNGSYGVVINYYYSYSIDAYFIHYWSPSKNIENWNYGVITEWGLENYKPSLLGNIKALNGEQVIREEIECNI